MISANITKQSDPAVQTEEAAAHSKGYLLYIENLSRAVNESFKALDKLKFSDSPLACALLRYRDRLPEKLCGLTELRPLNPKWVDELLSELGEERLQGEFSILKTKLITHSNFLAELQETGIKRTLGRDLRLSLPPVHIVFMHDPGAPQIQNSEDTTVRGYYNQKNASCFIKSPHPQARQLWRTLLLHGTLPGSVGTLDHELTHALQMLKVRYGPKISKEALLLLEVHAHEATCAAASAPHPSDEGSHSITRRLHKRFAKLDDFELKVHTAYTLLRSLRLFGTDDTELAQLVQRDSFDKKHKTYPLLKAHLAELIDSAGVKGCDVAPVIAALNARFRLERELTRIKARTIAQEQLAVIYRNVFATKSAA